MTKKQTKINVQGTEIAIYLIEQKDYISLTDIAKSNRALFKSSGDMDKSGITLCE